MQDDKFTAWVREYLEVMYPCEVIRHRRMVAEKPSFVEQAKLNTAGLRTGYCQGIEPFFAKA